MYRGESVRTFVGTSHVRDIVWLVRIHDSCYRHYIGTNDSDTGGCCDLSGPSVHQRVVHFGENRLHLLRHMRYDGLASTHL